MFQLMRTLAGSFFKIGLFTLGGGLAVIPLVQQEMLARGWLTNAQFLDILGIAQATPGPMGVNTATFVGYRVTSLQGHGVAAALFVSFVATVAVMLPSVIGVAFGGPWFERHRDEPLVKHVFAVLRPVVAGFVCAAGAGLSFEVFGILRITDWSAFVFSPVSCAVFAVSVWLTWTHRFSPLWGFLVGALASFVPWH